MLRQRLMIELTRGWERYAVLFDVGIQPIGGGAAGGAKEGVESAMNRPVQNGLGKVDLSDPFQCRAAVSPIGRCGRLHFGLMCRRASGGLKCHADVPLAEAGGCVTRATQ